MKNRPDRQAPVGAVWRAYGRTAVSRPGRARQARVAMASLKVADGRMTAAALVTSGW